MTDPNLFDISRDDELLDALATRSVTDETVADLRTDPLFVDLSLWTAQIDMDAAAARSSAPSLVADDRSSEQDERRVVGRHRRNSALGRAGRRSVRAGFVFAAAGTALSFSGVAAAVNGGHLPQITSFHFPAAGGPVKGASVLADVPSAVPTSPGLRQERPKQALPPVRGTKELGLPGQQDKAKKTSHPEVEASHEGAPKPAKQQDAAKAPSTAPITKPKPTVSRLPHTGPRPTSKTGTVPATRHGSASKHATHPSHSRTSGHPTTRPSSSTTSHSKPTTPSTKPSKTSGKRHGASTTAPVPGSGVRSADTHAKPGDTTNSGQGASPSGERNGKAGAHHQGKRSSEEGQLSKGSRAHKAGARRVITGVHRSQSATPQTGPSGTAPTAGAVTPPTQEK